MLFVTGNSGSQKQSAFLNLFLNGGGGEKMLKVLKFKNKIVILDNVTEIAIGRENYLSGHLFGFYK